MDTGAWDYGLELVMLGLGPRRRAGPAIWRFADLECMGHPNLKHKPPQQGINDGLLGSNSVEPRFMSRGGALHMLSNRLPGLGSFIPTVSSKGLNAYQYSAPYS